MQTPELAKQQLCTWITLSVHFFTVSALLRRESAADFWHISLFISRAVNTNDVVKLDQNGNVIFALISKIVSWRAIVGNTHRVPPFETWISQHFDKVLNSLQFNTAMLVIRAWRCLYSSALTLVNRKPFPVLFEFVFWLGFSSHPCRVSHFMRVLTCYMYNRLFERTQAVSRSFQSIGGICEGKLNL